MTEKQEGKRARKSRWEGPSEIQQAVAAQQAEDVHWLSDPALLQLRQSLATLQPLATRQVVVASPLPGDSQAKAFASKLLDLQLYGRGAKAEDRCLMSRIELASVSAFYEGAANFADLPTEQFVDVGHAGVKLLVEGLYRSKVTLDATAAVDLLQAATYLQVDCAIQAACVYLSEECCGKSWPAQPSVWPELLAVAGALNMEGWRRALVELCAAKFLCFQPGHAADFLQRLEHEERAALLSRQDLHAPLEFFVVQALASLSWLEPDAVAPLLDCVRWAAMSRDELLVAAAFLQQQELLHPRVEARFAWRLLEALQRGDEPPQGRRTAAALCVAHKFKYGAAPAAGRAWFFRFPDRQKHAVWLAFEPSEHTACKPAIHTDGVFPAGFNCLWLVLARDGLHMNHMPPTKRPAAGFIYNKIPGSYVEQALPQPGEPESRVLMVACYLWPPHHWASPRAKEAHADRAEQ